MTIQTTIYLNPILHRTLKIKSIETRRSLSYLIQDAIKNAMQEDAIDLKEIEKRKVEPEISYDMRIKNSKNFRGRSN